MPDDPLLRAWVWLGILSVATTVASLGIGIALPQALGGGAILIFAWLKARLILARYLGLDQSVSIKRGFDLVLALYMALIYGLYLMPEL